MKKQKASNWNDLSIKTPKNRKFATPSSSQTHSQQTLSQSIDLRQIIDPTFDDNLDQLRQIWNRAKNNEITLSQDQVRSQIQFEIRLTEMKNRLALANQEIEKLQKNIHAAKEEHEKMAKYIAGRCKTRDVIIAKQNIAANLSSLIKEHINAIIDNQEQCEESQQHLTELYNDVALKEEKIIKILTKQINNKVSKKKKKFDEELELKCNELLSLKINSEQLKEEIKKKTQFINDLNSKIKEHEVIIEKDEKRHKKEIAQILESIKEKESILKVEQKAKYKLEEECNESSTRYNELFVKFESLQVVDSGYRSQIECLTSNVVELKEETKSLNDQLVELKDVHFTLLSSKDLESAECRKQLQDLVLINTEANNKLRKAVTNNEELLKTAAKTVEESEQLENLIKTKADEIMKTRRDLRNVLDKNEELNEEIQNQNQELINIDKEICKNKVDFETYEAERDESAKREANISTELAMIEQQQIAKCEEFAKLLKEAEAEKNKSSEEAAELKREGKQKDELFTREQKANADLQKEIGQKQSEYKKKIQHATHLSKQCQLARHDELIKEQDVKINSLNQELSGEKLKNKQANEKKNASEAMEKEKYETQMKKMKGIHEDLVNKLKEAEILIETKKSKQETIPTSPRPKPILKSPMKKSPLRNSKVRFDLGPSLAVNQINMLERFKESEKRYAASAAGADRPNWGIIRIPTTPEEPDTTSPTVTESQSLSQYRKFFKHPRMDKKIFQIGKK